MSSPHVSTRDKTAVYDLRLKLRLDRDRRTWMYSKNFWAHFGVRRRTPDRIEAIRQLLDQNNLVVTTEGDFGTESMDSTLWIQITDVAPYPAQAWFTQMRDTRLRTERDVESFFILPLLQQLGYTPADIVTEEKIPIYRGKKKLTHIIADFVIQNHDTGRPLLVVEAKSASVELRPEHVEQARSYAYWLHAPAWLLTNGTETRLYHSEVARPPSIALTFTRDDIESAWPAIITHLSPESIHHFASQFWHPLDDAGHEEETN